MSLTQFILFFVSCVSAVLGMDKDKRKVSDLLHVFLNLLSSIVVIGANQIRKSSIVQLIVIATSIIGSIGAQQDWTTSSDELYPAYCMVSRVRGTVAESFRTWDVRLCLNIMMENDDYVGVITEMFPEEHYTNFYLCSIISSSGSNPVDYTLPPDQNNYRIFHKEMARADSLCFKQYVVVRRFLDKYRTDADVAAGVCYPADSYEEYESLREEYRRIAKEQRTKQTPRPTFYTTVGLPDPTPVNKASSTKTPAKTATTSTTTTTTAPSMTDTKATSARETTTKTTTTAPSSSISTTTVQSSTTTKTVGTTPSSTSISTATTSAASSTTSKSTSAPSSTITETSSSPTTPSTTTTTAPTSATPKSTSAPKTTSTKTVTTPESDSTNVACRNYIAVNVYTNNQGNTILNHYYSLWTNETQLGKVVSKIYFINKDLCTTIPPNCVEAGLSISTGSNRLSFDESSNVIAIGNSCTINGKVSVLYEEYSADLGNGSNDYIYSKTSVDQATYQKTGIQFHAVI